MSEIIKVSSVDIPELDFYHKLNEAQLLHYFEPDDGVFIVESPKVIERALRAGYEPLSILCDLSDVYGKTSEIINKAEVPVYVAERELITELTGFNLIRGALCLMRRKKHATVEQICKNAKYIAVLENVVNPSNVGSIFRSAAGLGIDGIILTNTCADPLYRRSSRVSMGTVFQVPWTYFNSNKAEIDYLHLLGFKTASMALVNNSVDIDDIRLNSENKLAIILGAEGYGLSDETISKSDYTVCIPMSNEVDSLNVAAASAVAFWQICRGKKS